MEFELDKQAVSLSETYLNCEPRLLATLMEMAEENLFIKMEYSGMWEYLVKRLHLTESQAGYFQRVAARARAVPELKKSVLAGEISLSQARRIVGVITSENADYWIEAAGRLNQKELERLVSEESPRRHVREGIIPLADHLSKLTVVISEEEEEQIERAKDVVSQSLQKPATYQQTLGAMVTLFLEKKDPVKKAERASLRTSRVVKWKMGKSFVRKPIPAAIKHQVHLRDGFRCAFTHQNGERCETRRFLHLHHAIPVSQGGPDTVENLTTRCFWHHQCEHLNGSLKSSSA